MPKFNDKEKDMIYKNLQIEGEKLFSIYGLKKVTVDDIVNAVGIAKGSFYAFYKNKEELFMELNSNAQQKIFNNLENYIKSFNNLTPKEYVKLAIKKTLKDYYSDPIISHINADIWKHLKRKLSDKSINAHINDDNLNISKLSEQFNIKFKYDMETVTKTLENLYATSSGIKDDEIVLDIFVNGVVDQIVED